MDSLSVWVQFGAAGTPGGGHYFGMGKQDRSKDEFLAALRQDFAGLPGMNIVIGQPISHRIDHMLSGTRANIAVKIFGHDLYE